MNVMIRIAFLTDSQGLIQEFTVKGHAGYDEAGKDIVCAAVSAVVQTAVIGLTDVAEIIPNHVQDDGLLKCSLPQQMNIDQRKASSVILRTMLAGLESIRNGYPNLISIRERKVD